MLILPEDPFLIFVELPVTRPLLDAMARFCRDNALDYRCRQIWPAKASRARWCFNTERDALAFTAHFGGEIGFALGGQARRRRQP